MAASSKSDAALASEFGGHRHEIDGGVFGAGSACIKGMRAELAGTRPAPAPEAVAPEVERPAAAEGGGQERSWKLAPSEHMGNPDVYFHPDWGLRVHKVVVEILNAVPAALSAEGRVALYEDGVYRVDGSGYTTALAVKLRNRYRPTHRKTAEEYAAALLNEQDLRLPTHTSTAVLNCVNGMVDLGTGELAPHHPKYLSTTQIPVAWEEDASCPMYEWWLADVGLSEGQVEALEEVVSTMLDPSRTPTKAGFLFGPSRSGKSTFLRLAQAMAGVGNCSAVTLHQLSDNRFMAANVFGKMLNAAADLSGDDVDDLSMFKMLTGEDLIQADRKYGTQFAFTNRALFLFSANDLPTVSETSNAYVERIVPFRFGRSFAGAEKPEIEAEILANELPGVLARWVRAWQRRQRRGGYASVDVGVMSEFLTRSNRVAAWVADQCRIVLGWDSAGKVVLSPDPDLDEDEKREAMSEAEARAVMRVAQGSKLPTGSVTSKRELSSAFNRWAQSQGGSSMGERKVFDRLTSMNGIHEVRNAETRARGLNVIYDWTKWAESE
jgi:putative DNA primase/helicase